MASRTRYNIISRQVARVRMSKDIIIRRWNKLLYTSGNFQPPLYIAVEENVDGFFRARWHDESCSTGRIKEWNQWGHITSITTICSDFLDANPDWERSNMLAPLRDRWEQILED